VKKLMLLQIRQHRLIHHHRWGQVVDLLLHLDQQNH
jgi:hypothetical protein